MPKRLRLKLWDAIYSALERVKAENAPPDFFGADSDNAKLVLRAFWTEVLHQPLSALIGTLEPALVEDWFMERASWTEVYDAVEFVADYGAALDRGSPVGEALSAAASRCALILREERAAWGFVGTKLAPLGTEAERVAVEAALETAPEAVAQSIEKALQALSHRTNPDIAGAVTHAVSAVESAGKHALGDKKYQGGTFGSFRQTLKARGGNERAIDGMDKLVSAAHEFARHGLKVGATHEKSEALGRFYVVTCAAFATYILDELRPRS